MLSSICLFIIKLWLGTGGRTSSRLPSVHFCGRCAVSSFTTRCVRGTKFLLRLLQGSSWRSAAAVLSLSLLVLVSTGHWAPSLMSGLCLWGSWTSPSLATTYTVARTTEPHVPTASRNSAYFHPVYYTIKYRLWIQNWKWSFFCVSQTWFMPFYERIASFLFNSHENTKYQRLQPGSTWHQTLTELNFNSFITQPILILYEEISKI